MTARSPVRTTRPIRYSLLWYSLAVSTKLTVGRTIFEMRLVL